MKRRSLGYILILFCSTIFACRDSNIQNGNSQESAALAANKQDVSDINTILNQPGEAEQKKVLALLDRLKSLVQRDKNPKYYWSPEEIHSIVKEYSGQEPHKAFPAIHKRLKEKMPGRVADQYRFNFNAAGGVLSQIAVIFATPHEYIVFFGTAIPTAGYSGLLNVEYYDMPIIGEMQVFDLGTYVRRSYLPGTNNFHPRMKLLSLNIPDQYWMVEYARGDLISAFNFGVIGPAMFVTMDWQSAWNQISDFTKLVFKSTFGDL